MKKHNLRVLYLTMFLILIATITSISISANNDSIFPVSVTLDGKSVFTNPEQPAIIVNAVTYVPLRAYCALMGSFDLDWNHETRTATITAPGINITARAGEQFITVNDRYFYCPDGTFILDGTLYVPVRVISKAYGVEVGWSTNGSHGTVILSATGERAARADDIYDSEVLYWLSRIISAESRGESLDGQIAVGNVVLNRVRNDSFPNTVYDVVFDTKFGIQFTPIANGTIYDTPAESSVVAAKICLEGTTLSDSILYFLNISAASNLWVPNNRNFVMAIGVHSFYS